MMMEEILAGESKNVEFKERLPGRSIQYMKSVVAFANGSGGKIIFGIADKTREVVGFEEEDAFRTMDAIANATPLPMRCLIAANRLLSRILPYKQLRIRPLLWLKSLREDSGLTISNRWDGMPVSTFVLPERPARPMNI